jgi:mono/diheme cytochrome c family protein
VRRLPSHGGLARAAPAVLLSVLLLPASAAGEGPPRGDAAHGRIVFALAGGCGCHSSKDAPVGAGGAAIKTPFGTFYGTNITPDDDTGIGRWTDDEVIAAIREGYARDSGVEAPVMPYAQYGGMADDDVRDLVAYLRTLPPVRRASTPAEVRLPFARLAYRAWRWLFAPAGTAPARAPSEPVARGRYLAQHVSICGDCHTPRTGWGTLDAPMYLAGAEDGPNGERVPNITQDAATGIGKWTENAIVQLLQTAMKPDMDNVQGLMGEVVDGLGGGPGYAQAPESELRSIAKYLKTVPPIRHEVSK